MIFFTVGTQFSFDRLLSSFDKWKRDSGSGLDAFGQIGDSHLKDLSFPNKNFINLDEYSKCFEKADIIVSHAGMGTVLKALSASKPIIVMPRLFKYSEHRNDHQVATCKKIRNLNGCYVAETEGELHEFLNNISSLEVSKLPEYAPEEFQKYIYDQIFN